MTAEPTGWGARGWHRERRRPERSADELYQGNQKPAVLKARTNSKCAPATHGIDNGSCVVLHVPPGATCRQAASRLSAGSSITPPAFFREGCPCPHTAGGSSGGCSSKAILQPNLFCPLSSKSFQSQGREIIHPSLSMVCGFGHLGQGLHQLVASSLAVLGGGTHVKTWKGKVRTAEASCPLICWGILLWFSTETDAMSQAHHDNTSAERRADFIATETQPGALVLVTSMFLCRTCIHIRNR